jgi:hypothetical protein
LARSLLRISGPKRGTAAERTEQSRCRDSSSKIRLSERFIVMQQLDCGKIVSILASQFVALACLAVVASAEGHAPAHVPMLSSPTIHEGAQINTEARAIYMYNDIPKGFITPNGQGTVHALTFQLRYALNERWALIMTKGGFISTDFENSLPDDDGPSNFAFGAKYAIIAEPGLGRYLSVGGRYEAPIGDVNAGNVDLQGEGSGMFDTFMSWSSRVGDKTAFQSSAGFSMALDSDDDSSFFHYSFHVDYEALPQIYGFLEGNLLTTIREGDRTDATLFGSFEGYDLFNFGNTSSGTVATLGVGARYRLTEYLLFGAGFEFPVTGREDIVNFRFLSDAVLQF